MGFFDRMYYGKAGKRDYSEMDMPKNRVSLFFMVLKDHVFDLVKGNLMQVIFWIPFLLWTYINLAAVQSIDTGACRGRRRSGLDERYFRLRDDVAHRVDSLYRHYGPVVVRCGLHHAQLGA